MLPEAFTQRMQEMLGEEYPAFLQSYEEEKKQSLRINPLKGDKDAFLSQNPFTLTQVEWEENGFYFEPEDRPGKHPFHEAGVYYIQEASAMFPVTLLEAEKGERVLDLCAAPGGKSTQIAAAMQGKGLLICNEIHPARAKILSENIERMGVTNALVVSHAPDELARHFQGYFDRILVDAPCSGEGMFRKNDEAMTEWSPENVAMCAARQDEVLFYAAQMLAPGGRLVYSTCTFAPEENEGSINRFLKAHPDFWVVKVGRKAGIGDVVSDMVNGETAHTVLETAGISHGNPKYVEHPVAGLENTFRLWPHKLKGEGHFAAVLQKQGTLPQMSASGNLEKGIAKKELKEYLDFEKNVLKKPLEGTFLKFGDQLYLAPDGTPALKGLKVLRPGLHLGTIKKNRFEPSHSLALALGADDVTAHMELSAEGKEVTDYLSGLVLEGDLNGWCLITVSGYSIGWGKGAGGRIKNHYPKGLRKTW